jgi:pyruvate dehydrogenase complex dehydrogenase (E1) component
VEAHEKLIADGIRSRVVSMPSWDLFDHQSREYRESILPPTVKARVAVEQGSTLGWERYIGESGRVIGMHTFGASAPLKELQRKFGFQPDRVVAAAKELLGGCKRPRRHNLQAGATREGNADDAIVSIIGQLIGAAVAGGLMRVIGL